jgi:glycosyltransferase involved in cell wall biosynthesis
MKKPTIDFVIPTLWRADRLEGLVANIHDTTTHKHRIIFVCEHDDTDTVIEVRRLKALDRSVVFVRNIRASNCCGAFNSGHAHVRAPYWFAAGDDLLFHAQWDEPCMSTMLDEELGAKIVGTRDLYNINVEQGWTATHFLVDTEYSRDFGLTFDEEPGVVAHEGYGHDFFDTEACHVATTRGVFQPCLASIVEHQHWCFGRANVDETYQRSQDMCKGDPEVFAARKEAWDAKYEVAA